MVDYRTVEYIFLNPAIKQVLVYLPISKLQLLSSTVSFTIPLAKDLRVTLLIITILSGLCTTFCGKIMKASVGFILDENVMCWQKKLKHEHKFSSFLVYLFQHIFHPKHRLVVILLFSSLKACIFKWRSCFMISIVLTTTISDLSFSYV